MARDGGVGWRNDERRLNGVPGIAFVVVIVVHQATSADTRLGLF